MAKAKKAARRVARRIGGAARRAAGRARSKGFAVQLSYLLPLGMIWKSMAENQVPLAFEQGGWKGGLERTANVIVADTTGWWPAVGNDRGPGNDREDFRFGRVMPFYGSILAGKVIRYGARKAGINRQLRRIGSPVGV